MLRITKYLANRQKRGLTTTLRIAVMGLHTNSGEVIAMLEEAVDKGELELTEPFLCMLDGKSVLQIDYLDPEIAKAIGYSPAGITLEAATLEAEELPIAEVMAQSITDYKEAKESLRDQGMAELLDHYKGLTRGESDLLEQFTAGGLAGLVKAMEGAISDMATELARMGSGAANATVDALAPLALPLPLKCKLCGKAVTSRGSLVRGMGPNCLRKLAVYFRSSYAALLDPNRISDSLIEEMIKSYPEPERMSYGTYAEAVAAHPEGIVKVAEMKRRLKARGIPTNRLIKAMGGERGETLPLNRTWESFKVGGMRYLSAFADVSELARSK